MTTDDEHNELFRLMKSFQSRLTDEDRAALAKAEEISSRSKRIQDGAERNPGNSCDNANPGFRCISSGLKMNGETYRQIIWLQFARGGIYEFR